MSAEKFKVVARLGLSTSIPILINGEIGQDIDTKTFRVGDDTPEPCKVVTHKSTGNVIYQPTLTVTYGDINIHAGYKVDGVDISTMNQEDGIAVRIDDGIFTNRSIVGESNFIDVLNPNGKDGNFTIKLSENVKNLLGGDTVSAVRFTYGPTFPEDPFPGHIHYNDDEEMLYIYTSQEQDNYSFWLGISSFINESTRYPKFFQQTERPLNGRPGDTWFEPEDEKLFLMFAGDEEPYWVEVAYI